MTALRLHLEYTRGTTQSFLVFGASDAGSAAEVVVSSGLVTPNAGSNSRVAGNISFLAFDQGHILGYPSEGVYKPSQPRLYPAECSAPQESEPA